MWYLTISFVVTCISLRLELVRLEMVPYLTITFGVTIICLWFDLVDLEGNFFWPKSLILASWITKSQIKLAEGLESNRNNICFDLVV